ncbi:MAG: DUF2227 family putative metal-binding protein [Bacteriovoracaceae bacterium]|nr:DUF2227 family putative metal-binding protein [Bacteriovoracaceae bacterium]
MASGKFHDKVNLGTGAILTGCLLGFERSVPVVLSFVIGWLFATLIFSPDTDVMPKKRSGFLQFFLYPYSILFKHRGVSHMILVGTIIRVIYGVIIFGIMLFVLNGMDYVSIGANDFFNFVLSFLKNYKYELIEYKIFTWLFIGMVGADICHVVFDQVSSFVKKILRFI